MNKYQEALDRMYDNYVYGAKQKEDSYFTLQELVDKVPYYEELEAKATPKKPINDKCPSCQSIHIYYRESRDSLWLVRLEHCPHCGQALKWNTNERPTK